MSVMNIPKLVSGLRIRTGLTREMLTFSNLLMDSSTRYRLENGKTRPTLKNFESYMKDIDLPLEGFIYPLLENQPARVHIICNHLVQALELGDTTLAQSLLDELEILPGFKYELNRQFLLCKKARLWLLQGKPTSQIYPLIYESINITYDNFDENDLSQKILVLEEPELIHALACTNALEGKRDEAIRLLNYMQHCLKVIPNTDKEKEQLFTAILLTLSKCQLEENDYDGVLITCDLGIDFSINYKQGRLTPEFEHNKALAMYKLRNKEKCCLYVRHAYMGYVLLGEINSARSLQFESVDKLNVSLNLYGIDKIECEDVPKAIYNRGKHIAGSNPGEMIYYLRNEHKISLANLSCGICSESTLSRIESGTQNNKPKVVYDVFIMELMMQRMGCDIHLYHNFFLDKNAFVAVNLRDKINRLLTQKKTSEAMDYLNELESVTHFCTPSANKEYRMNRQFIAMAKATVFSNTHGYEHSDLVKMLLSALLITCPHFDERDIDKHPVAYTYNELFLINQLAMHFNEIGDTHRAVDIYAQVHRNLNEKYIDELEKARMYSSVLFNYSTYLGKIKKYDKTLEILEEIEQFERSRSRLTNLPKIVFNKGYNKLMLGADAKDVIPHFILAYYGCSLLANYGLAHDMLIIRNFMTERFNIILD